MADSSYKNIENIQSGDVVKSYNMSTQQYCNATVQVVNHLTSSELPGYTLKINNVYTSPNQVFLVNGTLKEARNITINDQLRNVSGNNVTVSSISNVTSFGDMYKLTLGLSSDNIIQPNNLTYFAGGMAVYPWGPDGSDDYCGEAETMGVDLFNNIAPRGGELIFRLRAEASDGCEVWKYNPTTAKWTPVINGTTGPATTHSGFGDTTNWGCGVLINFNGYLFAGTWSSPNNGCEVWRYDGSTWTKVVSGGFSSFNGGSVHNCAVTSMAVFKNRLYVGTMNWHCGYYGFCQVWRNTTPDCSSWEMVVDRGFRDIIGVGPTAKNVYAWRMAVFKGMLYVGTFNAPTLLEEGERGCELFRSGSGNLNDWHKVKLKNDNSYGYNEGFGEVENYGIRQLDVIKDQQGNDLYLYVGVAANFMQWSSSPNHEYQALEIWRYDDSNSPWENIVGGSGTQHNSDGFGSKYNKYPWSMCICNNKLWVGTLNIQLFGDPGSYGCEVWNYDGTNVNPIVKNKEGAILHEQKNGFGHDYDIAARSMIEFPAGSGQLVVGTVSLINQFDPRVQEYGCEIWIRYP